MKFIKFVIVYLLLFTSYISYRFSQLEPEHLHAISLAIGSIASLFTALFSAFSDIFNPNSGGSDGVDTTDVDFGGE
jgi:hypothetical protein